MSTTDAVPPNGSERPRPVDPAPEGFVLARKVCTFAPEQEPELLFVPPGIFTDEAAMDVWLYLDSGDAEEPYILEPSGHMPRELAVRLSRYAEALSLGDLTLAEVEEQIEDFVDLIYYIPRAYQTDDGPVASSTGATLTYIAPTTDSAAVSVYAGAATPS